VPEVGELVYAIGIDATPRRPGLARQGVGTATADPKREPFHRLVVERPT
jgi:hypothetical protein